jgi:hypothetical protein
MKTFLLALTLTTLISSAFAGILENRMTGETLEFNLDRQNQEISILSTSANIANTTLYLNSLQRATITDDLFALSNWSLCKYNQYCGPEVLTLPVTFALDVVSMPLRATIVAIKTIKVKKDYKKLMRAINSTRVITVSDNRFRRIESILTPRQQQ